MLQPKSYFAARLKIAILEWISPKVILDLTSSPAIIHSSFHCEILDELRSRAQSLQFAIWHREWVQKLNGKSCNSVIAHSYIIVRLPRDCKKSIPGVMQNIKPLQSASAVMMWLTKAICRGPQGPSIPIIHANPRFLTIVLHLSCRHQNISHWRMLAVYWSSAKVYNYFAILQNVLISI